MLKEHGLAVFEDALTKLDGKLQVLNKRITIRAIGGFVMLYNGVTEHGYTMDIDSLTEDYDSDIIVAIREVASECNLDPDWLNNDCASLEGFIDDLALEISWITTNYLLKNIDMYVADFIGMVRVKAKAIHDGGLVPRKTDKKDLMLLLKMGDVNSLEELNMSSDFDFIKFKYKRAYDFLTEMQKW